MDKEQFQLKEQIRKEQGQSVISFIHQEGLNQYRYYKLLRSITTEEGEFLPVGISGSSFGTRLSQNPARIQSSKSRKGNKEISPMSELDIQMRTKSGTELRISGYFDSVLLRALISSSGGLTDV